MWRDVRRSVCRKVPHVVLARAACDVFPALPTRRHFRGVHAPDRDREQPVIRPQRLVGLIQWIVAAGCLVGFIDRVREPDPPGFRRLDAGGADADSGRDGNQYLRLDSWIGATTQLTATAVRSDGSTQDVTARQPGTVEPGRHQRVRRWSRPRRRCGRGRYHRIIRRLDRLSAGPARGPDVRARARHGMRVHGDPGQLGLFEGGRLQYLRVPDQRRHCPGMCLDRDGRCRLGMAVVQRRRDGQAVSGSGPATVAVSVNVNSGLLQSARVRIRWATGGTDVVVSQAGSRTCVAGLAPDRRDLGAAGAPARSPSQRRQIAPGRRPRTLRSSPRRRRDRDGQSHGELPRCSQRFGSRTVR